MLLVVVGRFQFYLCLIPVYDASTDQWRRPALRMSWGFKRIINIGRKHKPVI